jgi:hypothetical protein
MLAGDGADGRGGRPDAQTVLIDVLADVGETEHARVDAPVMSERARGGAATRRHGASGSDDERAEKKEEEGSMHHETQGMMMR